MTNKVYAAIAAVMADMAKEGISKDRRNQQQGYNFRGIDEVYNALSPILSKHKLVMLPRILARECVERQTRNGGALFNVTVEAEFDLVCADDGSKHTIRTFGEAMDSADKATNKAMSAAYKYAAMQAFCIPTEGDNDADATTHDVAPQPKSQSGVEDFNRHLNAISSATGIGKLQAAFATAWRSSLPDKDKADLKAAYEQRKDELSGATDDFPGFVDPQSSLDKLEQEAQQAVRNMSAG